MWMMGYNDEGSSDFNFSNSCTGSRKLRPLVPRPTSNAATSTPPPPCLSRLHGTDVFSLNHHHISNVGEQGKTREFNSSQSSSVVVSSRWNPTPEQLQTLEDLYRRGTRTPSAEQIQHITAQLRRYGKIEGKNVFYWFQNHKARERQKRRRQLTDEESSAVVDDDIHKGLFETKESGGGSRTLVFELEQTKNWPPPTNCSTLPEESVVSIQRAGGGGAKMAECRRRDDDIDDGWVQFEKGELQQHSSSNSSRRHFEKNATWQMMQLSCPPPSCSSTAHHHLINATTTTSCTAAATTATETTAAAAIRSRMDPTTTAEEDDLNNNTTNIENNFFTTPSCNQLKKNVNYFNNNHVHDKESSSSRTTTIGESHQTLQLFPLESLNETKTGRGGDDDQTMTYQYFEFLPLKKN